MTGAGSGDARALAIGLKREMTGVGLKAFAALCLHAAASHPERLAAIYDGAADGWGGSPVTAPPIKAQRIAAAPVPPQFWTAFWALLETPPGTLGAGGVTARTAELCGLVDPTLTARLAAAAVTFPGVDQAVAQGYPQAFTRDQLAACPPDSLGGAFHRLIVENGFDLEVLDRESLGLSRLPPVMAYVNARILQCHDLWHITAGYETTGLHEVAISAFQMGQFGHPYSAMFLAMVLARIAFERPPGANVILDTILGAWAHGRQSPPLLGVRWEDLWDQPVEAVRQQLALTPYSSPWPADLFESLNRAA